MKRKRIATAEDGNSKVKVSIDIDFGGPGGLTKDEQMQLLEQIASGVMQVMASAKYLHVQLSEIRVK
jgi:hypothetical protein